MSELDNIYLNNKIEIKSLIIKLIDQTDTECNGYWDIEGLKLFREKIEKL